MSIGENSHREIVSGCGIGTHAEMASKKHLMRSKITRNRYWKKKKIIVNLVVIRVNSGGSLGSSLPCKKCTQYLYADKCIKINWVYYSDSDGTIKRIKFNKLLDKRK